jgi:hypothetical protein
MILKITEEANILVYSQLGRLQWHAPSRICKPASQQEHPFHRPTTDII